MNEETLLDVILKVSELFGVVIAIGIFFAFVIYTTAVVSEWLKHSRLQAWVVAAMVITYFWLACVAMGYFITVYNNGLDK